MKRFFAVLQWLPVLVGVGVSVATLFLWQALVAQERVQIKETVELAAASVKNEIDERMNSRISALDRMAKRWEYAGKPAQEKWEFEAGLNIKNFEAYQAIQWVDPTYRVRWIVPLEGNELTKNLSLAFEPPRWDALVAARDGRNVTVTRSIDLVQGRKGFEIYVPIFKGEEFSGFITGVFQTQELLDTILKDWKAEENTLPRYSIAVFDGKEEIYSHNSDSPTAGAWQYQKWGQETKIDLHSITWRVQVWPSPELLAEEGSLLPEATLIGGLSTAFVLTWAVYLAQQARRRARETETTNQELDHEIREHKRTEEALRESQQMLKLVTDNIPQFIFWKDRNSVYLGCNRNFAQSAGVDNPENIVGKTDYNLPWKQEEANFFRECDRRIMETDTPEYHIIEPLLQANGEQAWLNTNKVPLHDSEGNVVGILGTFEDITERKRVEEALHQAHSKLEIRVEERTAELTKTNERLRGQIFERQRAEEEVRLLQAITQSISESQNFHSALEVALRQICEATGWSYGEAWVPEPDDPYKHTPEVGCLPKLKCSPAWYASAAYQEHLKGEYLGFEKFRSLSEGLTFPPHIGLPGRVWLSKRSEWMQDVSAVSDTAFLRVQAAVEAGLKASLGVPILTPSTQSESSDILAVLVFFMAESREEDQRLVEVVSTVATQLGSLIQRKRAEAALHSSVATNRALLDAIPDLMFRISKDGIFVNFKAAKDNDLPVPPDQLLGKNLAEVFPKEVAQPALDSVKQALQTGNVQILEFQLLSNHNLKDYEARIVVSAQDEVLAIVRDITDRKQVEADTRNALEKEKELGELKSRFVSMTSHEFRTPLTTILSSAELLEIYSHKWGEEKKLTHFQRIQVAVKQMTGLLNDVLLIGKAEAGKLEFKPEPLNLIKFCRELVEEMELAASINKIDFHTQTVCTQNPCLTAWMDEKLLRHILSNLLSNAVKYSPQGGTVHFDLICNSEEVTLQVRDEGIGIPIADQAQLFNSFHRASNVGVIAGTGLGLAIVKKSVEVHGGKIAVKSEVGVGTIFTVSLPVNKQV